MTPAGTSLDASADECDADAEFDRVAAEYPVFRISRE
jgi:hypothetical protein